MDAIRKNTFVCCAREVLMTDLVAAGIVGLVGMISGWTQLAEYGNGLIWMGAGIFLLELMIAAGNLVSTGNSGLQTNLSGGSHGLLHNIQQPDSLHPEQSRYLTLMTISAGLAVGLGILLRAL